jgi:hypothetical protein
VAYLGQYLSVAAPAHHQVRHRGPERPDPLPESAPAVEHPDTHHQQRLTHVDPGASIE